MTANWRCAAPLPEDPGTLNSFLTHPIDYHFGSPLGSVFAFRTIARDNKFDTALLMQVHEGYRMSVFRLGISSYTFAWSIGVPGHPVSDPLDVFGLLNRAVELGVGVVQVADNLPLDRMPSASLDRLKHCADERSVRIEVGARGILPDYLQRNLEIARMFGTPILRTVIDTADHKPPVDEVIELLGGVLPRFADAGIVLAVENHDRFSTTDFLRILETLDSPSLGICLDTVNSFGSCEGPQVVVDALGPVDGQSAHQGFCRAPCRPPDGLRH